MTAHDRDPSSGSAGYGRVVDAMAAMGSLLTVLIAVMIVADVLSRNLFNLPLMGVVELVALMVVGGIYLQLPGSIRARRIARTEIVLAPLLTSYPRIAHALLMVFDLLALAAFAVIAYATWPRLERTWSGGEFIGHAGAFTFPAWPLPAVIMLGCAAAAVQYALSAYTAGRLAFAAQAPGRAR